MITRDSWRGALAGRRSNSADIKLIAPLKQSTMGGSGAFLGLASDNRKYWIKPNNNLQGPQVPVTEQIVGRIGSLFAAATCEVKTIEITSDFTDWQFRSGALLQEGIAHASLHVEDVIETWDLAQHRHMDDNRKRHATTFAMYDLCWGGDPQGLIALKRDNSFYSHDHGWYLPPNGPNWTEGDIEDHVDYPNELGVQTVGITPEIVEPIANFLDTITKDMIVNVLEKIPSSWPVRETDLEAVGFFIQRRAPAVAQRLREKFRGDR